VKIRLRRFALQAHHDIPLPTMCVTDAGNERYKHYKTHRGSGTPIWHQCDTMLVFYIGLLIQSAWSALPLPLYGRNLPLNSSSYSDLQAVWTRLNDTFRDVITANLADGHPYPANETSFSFVVFDSNRTLYQYNHVADGSYLAPESTDNVDGES
jgi:hypothetical protein